MKATQKAIGDWLLDNPFMVLPVCLIVGIALLIFPYNDADKAFYSSLGKNHHVTMYSQGVIVGEWVSSGTVSESNGGYYFKDIATGKAVTVSGDIKIITK